MSSLRKIIKMMVICISILAMTFTASAAVYISYDASEDTAAEGSMTEDQGDTLQGSKQSIEQIPGEVCENADLITEEESRNTEENSSAMDTEEPLVIEETPSTEETADPYEASSAIHKTTENRLEDNDLILSDVQKKKDENRNITLNVKEGQDISDLLRKTLKSADIMNVTKDAPLNVTIPAGHYKISKIIKIMSNTNLYMKGVTLEWGTKERGNLLMIGHVKDPKGGYMDAQNICLYGGTWKSVYTNGACIARVAHGTNIRFIGVTFSGGSCMHQIEAAGINGFTVKNCTFKDQIEPKDNPQKWEALQLDVLVADSVFPAYKLDGTMLKNVVITGCTFSNVPRGIGTHSNMVGCYHDNIKITNNTFKNVKEEAIICLNYTNCTIKGNVIKNCGRGIYVQSIKPTLSSAYNPVKGISSKVIHDANTVVANNKISVVKTSRCQVPVAIRIFGMKLTHATSSDSGEVIAKGDYYISGVTVKNNIINTKGNGICAYDTKKCKITKNTIKYTGADGNEFNGIYLESGSTGNVISYNKIIDAQKDGIFLYGRSSAKIIHNQIENAGRDGIHTCFKSTASQISENAVKNCENSGIRVESITGDMLIQKNSISKCKGTMINIQAGSKNCLVKIWKNRLYGREDNTGIQVLKGRVRIKSNKVTHTDCPVIIAAGVKQSIRNNQLKANKSNEPRIEEEK